MIECPITLKPMEPASGMIDDDGNAIHTTYWCEEHKAYITVDGSGRRIPNTDPYYEPEHPGE